MLKYLEVTVVATLLALVGFTATAHAAAAVDPSAGTPPDVLAAIYQALTGGHYAYVAALAIVAAVALVRKYGGSRWPALHTDLGSAALAVCGAFGASLSAALAGGGKLSVGMITGAGGVAFVALGGYAAANALYKKYVLPLKAKAPSWVQPLFTVVAYWFEHESDKTTPATPAAPAPGNTAAA